MATIDVNAVTHIHRGIVYLWETLTADDDGDWISVEGTSDISVWFQGTIDGATVTLQGTMDDGSTLYTLQQLDLTDISFTAIPDHAQVAAVPTKIRPKVTGGGTCDIDVYVCARQGGR